MSLKVFLLGFIFLITQHTVHCIQCYNCDAGTDGCGNSFNKNGAGVTTPIYLPTGGVTAYCGKAVFNTNANSILRAPTSSCTGSVTNVSSSTASGTDGYTIYCCTTDLCNGASLKSLNLLVATAAVVLGLFLVK